MADSVLDMVVSAGKGLLGLPDEVLVLVLWHLDVPELLAVSRTSHRLRTLALDPYIHHARLRYSSHRLPRLLSTRPPLSALQPPTSGIYLSRTHLAARRLHWSLVCIRLNRSLSRRPAITSLVSANILPRECCRRDRASGDYLFAASERGGLVTERKRKVEREKVKEGLRVWLERKAGEILKRREKGVGVGVLVWRLQKRMKIEEMREGRRGVVIEGHEGRVKGLRSFWEGVGGGLGREERRNEC
ncbi:hypothetical protein CAC42_6338 [Sphaceloma murrayae]|uniref:F-box domain-containing protein n=1 Tax=Sphaceloma murrayae TaxID=2082308 RepID=A0A2K1QML4_9PEZI|nr:hypothetical protein CAC42_6338 [Sphaceloma murrayae]